MTAGLVTPGLDTQEATAARYEREAAEAVERANGARAGLLLIVDAAFHEGRRAYAEQQDALARSRSRRAAVLRVGLAGRCSTALPRSASTSVRPRLIKDAAP